MSEDPIVRLVDDGPVEHLPPVTVPQEDLLMSIFQPAVKMRLTNIPLGDARGLSLATKCIRTADYRLENVDQRTFEVQYWFAHIVPVTLPSGEIVKRPRVVLVNPQGETLAWTSEVATKYWSEILGILQDGPPELRGGPWTPPLVVKVTSAKGKAAGRYYMLELDLPTAGKGAKRANG